MSGQCDNLTENCQTIKHFKHFKLDSKTFQTFKTLHSTTIQYQRVLDGCIFFLFLSVPASRNVILLDDSLIVQCEVGHVDKPCTWRGVLRLTGAQTIKTDREETEC